MLKTLYVVVQVIFYLSTSVYKLFLFTNFFLSFRNEKELNTIYKYQCFLINSVIYIHGSRKIYSILSLII